MNPTPLIVFVTLVVGLLIFFTSPPSGPDAVLPGTDPSYA